MADDNYLVPGRTCGSCTACCTHLAIVEDGMSKLPGVPCAHRIRGKGCAIYQMRPNVCRSYHCLWRSLDNLDASWRPDRSGIFMALAHAAPGSGGEASVDLHLVGPAKILFSDRFARMVAGFIESGTATHLNVQPGPGFLAHSTCLNGLLGPAIAARDLESVKKLIQRCYEDLTSQPRVPATAENIARSRSAEGRSPSG